MHTQPAPRTYRPVQSLFPGFPRYPILTFERTTLSWTITLPRPVTAWPITRSCDTGATAASFFKISHSPSPSGIYPRKRRIQPSYWGFPISFPSRQKKKTETRPLTQSSPRSGEGSSPYSSGWSEKPTTPSLQIHMQRWRASRTMSPPQDSTQQQRPFR